MSDFSNIKINVAYDEILVYFDTNKPLYANSNVAKYDIHPWHTITSKPLSEVEKNLGIKFPYYLKHDDSNELRHKLFQFASQNLDMMLDNTYSNFNKGTLQQFYNDKQNFIYPIVIYNNDLFYKYGSLELPQILVESLENGYAKLVFWQPTEGFFGRDNKEFIWIDNLCEKYKLKKEQCIIITSNFLAKNTYDKLVNQKIIKDSFYVYSYSYFGNSIWFHNGHKLNTNTTDSMREKFNESLQNNRLNQKKFHVLNFNRVPKIHRIALFGAIKSSPILKETSITTLGRCGTDNKSEFLNLMNTYISDDYRYNKTLLLDFFKSYDSTIHATYDVDDLENNKAEVFNKEAHDSSFVNLVTESLSDSQSIFFSEKIYKPMYACQPFILFGNPYSLKKLKEMGFQTFDKWWDESYDDEIDFTKRLEKIVMVLNEIASWSKEKCFDITNQMEEILKHNFEVMVSDHEIYELYCFLNQFKKETYKRLL